MDISNLNSYLVFTSDLSELEYFVLDVGRQLSKELNDKLDSDKIAHIAYDALCKLIEKSHFNLDNVGSCYAIRNIGILFEPELKINFVSLCKKYSRDSYFLIEHEGDIEDNTLYFLSRESGVDVNLADLNYTIL